MRYHNNVIERKKENYYSSRWTPSLINLVNGDWVAGNERAREIIYLARRKRFYDFLDIDELERLYKEWKWRKYKQFQALYAFRRSRKF